MLSIRPEQIAAFRDAQWENFAHDLLAQARALMPEVCAELDEGKSVELLLTAARRAELLGIYLTPDVTRYALLALRLGSDPADDTGAVGAAARDPNLLGSAKVEAVIRAAGV